MAKKSKAKSPRKSRARRPSPADKQTTGTAPGLNKTRPAITEAKLKALLRSTHTKQANISEISGEIGSEIKVASDRDFLHKGAFRIALKAYKMETEKLADFLDCLAHYFDISGINERAAQVQRLQYGPGEAAGEAGGEGDAGPDDDNVHEFRKPSSVAAE